MAKNNRYTPEEISMGLDLPKPVREALAKECKKLIKDGLSPDEVRARAVRIERDLMEKHRNAPIAAPDDWTDQQIASYNLEAASTGQPAMTRLATNQTRIPTKAEMDREDFARACGGGESEQSDDEYAPKGMHPKKLADINLHRACSGQDPLKPHPEDK